MHLANANTGERAGIPRQPFETPQRRAPTIAAAVIHPADSLPGISLSPSLPPSALPAPAAGRPFVLCASSLAVARRARMRTGGCNRPTRMPCRTLPHPHRWGAATPIAAHGQRSASRPDGRVRCTLQHLSLLYYSPRALITSRGSVLSTISGTLGCPRRLTYGLLPPFSYEEIVRGARAGRLWRDPVGPQPESEKGSEQGLPAPVACVNNLDWPAARISPVKRAWLLS